jgi:integrase
VGGITTSAAPELTPTVSVHTLRNQLNAAWSEIKDLRRTVAHQARLLENLAPETHPAEPSIACVYALHAEGRYHEKSWRFVWNRLTPLVRHLGDRPASELTPVAWERHRNVRRREADRHGKFPCEHTLNIELQRAKGMLDWAVAAGMLAFNPLKAAKYVKTKSQRETCLKPVDVDVLLESVSEVRDKRREDYDDDGARAAMLRALVLCWFDSMLRFNEARQMRRDLIEPDGSYPVQRETTKSDAGARTVVLTERTLEAIRAIPIHPRTNYVFVNDAGSLIGETTVRGWFRWACEHGRLDARAHPKDKRIVPHHLRHGGATAADAAGVRAGALQLALGHASAKDTARYLHRDKSDSAHHVAEKIQEAVRRGPHKAIGVHPEKRRGPRKK